MNGKVRKGRSVKHAMKLGTLCRTHTSVFYGLLDMLVAFVCYVF